MRRLGLAICLLLAMAAAGYAAFWFFMADRLRAGLDPWAAGRRAEGEAAHWDAVTVEGFPWVFRLRFSGARFGTARPIPGEIRTTLLIGEAMPWNLRRWRITAADGAELILPEAATTLSAGSVGGVAERGAAGDTVIDLTAHDLIGSGGASGLRAGEAHTLLTLPAEAPASHRDTALSASLNLMQLVLPKPVPPFGSMIETLSLAGALKGTLPGGPLREALAAWRDEGGTIEIAEGRLRWGSLAISANGTLALDATLQPIGALTATIEGHNAIVDAAVAAGQLRPGDASLAKTVLGLLAKPGPTGEKQITLPVSLQNALLYLGPAGIAKLPHITWE